ncbi:FliH/SctL family protein [Ideonella oryzae]|uniref:Flagellar assembly protein FliH n=1 Tax=Ideonella oryzae TaxID=2937441 RepID=A0ABT1BQB8_9BURK|nr:FliH/SctL family protein [Ideonella oryzae]MCO5978422.1 FliH/SctL family protein [Ideonella oryzae]
MTSSKPGSPRQVPPPQGGNGRPANAYARFIPREELEGFAAWTPDVFAGIERAPLGVSAPAPAPEPPPAEASLAEAGPTAEEWEARIHEARQQGWSDGYRDGLEALEAAKRQFAQQVSAQIAQVAEGFQDGLAELEARLAQTLVESAVTLARQVVRSELQQRPEAVVQVAHEAMAAVVLSARHLRLRLNPDDAALVAEGAADALKAREVQLVPDADIQRGGCRVESDLGQVDASIETRWAHAAAVFDVPLAWAEPEEELHEEGSV